jgi:hypothetical protein
MIYYHTTDAADAILRDGFRDRTASHGFATFVLTGVWLADIPLDVNEGAKGGQVLQVDLPDDVNLADFELIYEGIGMGYREWCVPAALINEHATVMLLNDDEVDEVEARFRGLP